MDTPEKATSELAKLDPLSILGMVESGVIDKEGLKKSLSLEAWGKVIKHSAYGGSGVVEMGGVWYAVRVFVWAEVHYFFSLLLCGVWPTV